MNPIQGYILEKIYVISSFFVSSKQCVFLSLLINVYISGNVLISVDV